MKQRSTRRGDPTGWPPLMNYLLVAGLALAAGGCKGEQAATPKAAAGASARASTIRADPADWCKGHAIPESMCTKCNPELLEGFKAAGDWCAEHEFPESACPVCNPVTPPSAAATATAKPARVGDAADWCKGHAIPESMCTKCNPELIERYKAAGDWCAAHEFPESGCPICSPIAPPGAAAPAGAAVPAKGAAAKTARVGDAADWCKGHAIPESMCTKCNPELLERFKAAGDWCAEHEFPESACPVCNPWAAPGAAPAGGGDARSGALSPGTRVRFRSPDLERAAGIQTVPGAVVSMAEGVEVTARVEFDGDALAEVRSSVAGIVREVSVDLGQQVAAGDALFVLESAQVGDLQARVQAARGRIQAARSELRRSEDLKKSGAVSAREVDVARQELRAAQSESRSIEQSLRISGAKDSGGVGRFTVHAPIAGSVVRRPALVGTYAAETDSLARIADTSRMWVLLDIAEWDAARVRTGQSVEVRVDGVPGRVFAGALTWMASEVSPRLRTVAARAEVDNADGLLRAGQFAHARVKVDAAVTATSIPLTAVQRVGDDSVVFVRVAEGVYEPRTVTLGRSDGRAVQVAGGIAPGDAVVTTGAYLLRTELSRESIGAGCCEVDTAGAK